MECLVPITFVFVLFRMTSTRSIQAPFFFVRLTMTRGMWGVTSSTAKNICLILLQTKFQVNGYNTSNILFTLKCEMQSYGGELKSIYQFLVFLRYILLFCSISCNFSTATLNRPLFIYCFSQLMVLKYMDGKGCVDTVSIFHLRNLS